MRDVTGRRAATASSSRASASRCRARYRSMFAAIHSGHPGVDPYTTAVSDVYQDLYGEGSFTGKGIYDVDAFERATRGRFPENTLLSHDLIEGNYARAGLATDINVYDDYPSRYLTYTRRKHRWIRGDWQLLRWLTPEVPGSRGGPSRTACRCCRAGRSSTTCGAAPWRSRSSPSCSRAGPSSPAHRCAGRCWAWAASPRRGSCRCCWRSCARRSTSRGAPTTPRSGQDAVTSAQQLALAIAFLPHQAWVSADAIVRTLWRLFVSQRYLLEWQTASQTERVVAGSGRDVWRTMWAAVAFPLLMLVAAGFAGAWHAGLLHAAHRGRRSRRGARTSLAARLRRRSARPALARVAGGRPRPERAGQLRGATPAPAAERNAAMRYALLHWRFFDRFAGAATNWLAPDNIQDSPDRWWWRCAPRRPTSACSCSRP